MPQSPESAAAVKALIETPFQVISERANPTDRPERLHHFTDASGTTGILSSKSLWASLATALNDATEVIYAVFGCLLDSGSPQM
jgi:hypothetical protein